MSIILIQFLPKDQRQCWPAWIFLGLLLAGCNDAPIADLHFALSSAPLTLNPQLSADAAAERIVRLIYRHLVDFDAHFRPRADLATWEIITPTRYRFTLGNDGRIFHDGSRLTARDVKATYDALRDPATASPYRNTLLNLRDIAVINPDQIDFILSRPDPWFPGRLTHGIVPARRIASGEDLSAQPIGSGAFSFLGRPDDGRLQLRRVADGLTIEFLEVKDPTVRVLKLLRGEADILQGDLAPELIRYLEHRPGVQLSRAQGNTFAYLGFNLRDPVTADLRIRRAIAAALDREQCRRYLLGGNARLASGMLPPEHWAGLPSQMALTHDPERARELLATAGYGPQRPLTLTYKTSNDPLRVRIATLLQRQLAQVGINLELRNYDWGTFYGDVRAGRFQMVSLSWVGIKTPEIFRYAFHSTSLPPDGANRGYYLSPRANTLIEAAENANSLTQAGTRYRELQELLLEDLPYIPLWYEDQIAIMRDAISGYNVATDGNYDALAKVSLHRNDR